MQSPSDARPSETHDFSTLEATPCNFTDEALRWSYWDAVQMHTEDIRGMRDRGHYKLFPLPGLQRMKEARHLSDSEIVAVARFEAEKDMNLMINRKARLGQ